MTEQEHQEPAETPVGTDSEGTPAEVRPAFPAEFQSAPLRETGYGQTAAESEYGEDTGSGSAERVPEDQRGPEDLGPVFDGRHAKEIQQRWHEIQAGFVDDPHDAIQQAGALNDEVVSSFTTALDDRKRTLEQGLAEGDTEQLRIGLRQYHQMLDQILTL